MDGASVRENVVSLARNIGYVPRSRTASKASVYFDVPVDPSLRTLTLQAGLTCIGVSNNSSYRFSLPEDVTAIVQNGIASFGTVDFPREIFQGSLLSRQFLVNTAQDQRFILDNPSIDTSTIRCYVKPNGGTGLGREFKLIDNILNLNENSEVFLVQEVQDEKYELLFGDGYFGKKLENGEFITVRYLVTDGENGNGPSRFDFQGTFVDEKANSVIPSGSITVNTVQKAQNGGEIEDVSSIKYFAPRLYSAQYRAVTARDYEAIISEIYPNTESVAVVGGEELSPPKFGSVQISIKPKNGTFVSDFDKQNILNRLKQYSIAGINQKIIDLKILYVELDSTIYYDITKASNADDLKTNILDVLTSYSNNIDMNRFGGRFKYSKVLQLIDRVDNAITSNITKIIIRRDLQALTGQFAQYELCFGNKFNVKPGGFNIKSTKFKIAGETEDVSIIDTPNSDLSTGTLSVVKVDTEGNIVVVAKVAGTVDYVKGEIILNTLNIASTSRPNDIIEIQAYPDSNDVIGLKDLYLSLGISNSQINMVKDVIASGEDISGVTFTRDYYTSSYSNGDLERK